VRVNEARYDEVTRQAQLVCACGQALAACGEQLDDASGPDEHGHVGFGWTARAVNYGHAGQRERVARWRGRLRVCRRRCEQEQREREPETERKF
jgi:hypothetical protein